MKEKIKDLLDSKIFSLEEMSAVVAKWKKQRKKIVFTNGCFDILHYGHLSYLIEGSRLGHKLILGLNSDASINKIKGMTRPIIKLEHRARMLSAFPFINAVVPFDDETPISLIRLLRPDILFKGADYAIDDVVGGEIVRSYGGEVKLLQFVDGVSTSEIVDKIKNECQLQK